MKQFACKACGSVDLFTKEKANNLMLYCSDCGAWQQNLGKNDRLLFEEYKKSMAENPITVEDIVIKFFKDNEVDCVETIHQMDRVIENAYQLLEDLFEMVKGKL